MGDVYIVVTGGLSEALNLANQIAPEHLELHVKEPDKLLKHVRSAGLVCLGYYSPVALADYCAGTNHILPTTGYARVCSGLGVQEFVKLIYVVKATREGLSRLKDVVSVLALVEGLPLHAKSVEERFK